ncbi:MAG: hypothetical protein INQ03_15020 [Candidatus Heimdallarchaeota archaeon]|nr:hypothetical protein [Candidatus Heimdallarchaeota archaeon]
MICDFCGIELEDETESYCSTCNENPIAIRLAQPLDQKYLDGSRALAATVKSASSKGIFVDLGLGFIGYFKSETRYGVDQEIAVRLKYPITTKDRGDNKTVPVIPLKTNRFKIVSKHLPVKDVTIQQLRDDQKGVGNIRSVVTGYFQVPRGPVIFDLVDENGDLLKVSVMKDDAPRLMKNTVINAIVRYKVVNDQERAQLYNARKVKATEAIEFLNRLASVNRKTKESIDDTEFFVDSGIYDGLKPAILEAAKKIRSAVFRNQNIIIRYHSPCIDGTAGAYAIDNAIRHLIETRGGKKEEIKRMVRRLPQRNPFFELREAARDLSFVLEEGENRFNLPLYILVDVGSTEESRAALELCKGYGVDVVIVDHHMPFDEIDDKAFAVVNPNLVDQNNNVNSGMLATELAKFVVPEVDINEEIIQLAATSGVYDRIEGDEINRYLELADANEFDRNRLTNIASALDYLTFGLRHQDGGEIVRNILGISGDFDQNTALIENITPTAQSLFAKSQKIMKDNLAKEDLANGSSLFMADFDNFAPRFEYPMHSDLLAAVHYKLRDELDNVVISIGHGSDYLIVRSSNLSFKFREFLESLQSAKPELGITGSGHRSVGSVQFLSGHKAIVLEEIKKLLSQ